MKLLIMAVLLGIVVSSKANGAPVEIILKPAFGVDSNVVAELSAWLTTSTKLPVHTNALPAMDEKKPQQLAEKSASTNVSEVVIALVQWSDNKDFRLVVFPEKRVAVLNIDGYVNEGAKWLDKADVFMLRVKREILKAQALALGVRPCIFPLCAFSDYESLSDLDWKGATPCPPCSGEYEKTLIKRGVKIE